MTLSFLSDAKCCMRSSLPRSIVTLTTRIVSIVDQVAEELVVFSGFNTVFLASTPRSNAPGSISKPLEGHGRPTLLPTTKPLSCVVTLIALNLSVSVSSGVAERMSSFLSPPSASSIILASFPSLQFFIAASPLVFTKRMCQWSLEHIHL
ncbi:hypothetical protein CVT26_014622 [Gymnopilus dilepis]|uniref:Uncharacterized protein n=1 Tax=Gymnopilus dilepis TaxID=231916 RepID=A0A409VWR9_9AGAR|nr:hypothetical protein CVT26_014622 [Gymnopilus dilepis]